MPKVVNTLNALESLSGLEAEALRRPVLLDEMQSRAMLFLHLF
jgi:hypothetical protein